MKKLPLLLAILAFSLQSAQAQVSKGLIGFWTFDDSTYRDVSPKNNDATWKNSRPAFAPGSPASVTGLRFSGGTEYLSVSDDSSLNVGTTGALSISFWMRMDTSEASHTDPRVLIAKRLTASGSTDYIIFTEKGRFYFGTGAATDTVVWMSMPTPTRGKWHHIVASVKRLPSSSFYVKRLYVDGALERSGTTTVKGSAVSSDLTFGMGSYGGTPVYFKGEMDEIRFYNRELSQTEVYALQQLTALRQEEPQTFSLRFANPFTNKLQLFNGGGSLSGTLTLRDMQGKLQFTTQLALNNNTSLEIAMPQEIPLGLYTCTLQTAKSVQTFKLLKQGK